MDKFLETKVAKPQTSDSGAELVDEKVKLELTSREVSDGEKIKVGKNTLLYLENDTSKGARKALKRVEYFKKRLLIPGNARAESNFIINDSDGGRFTELSTPESSVYFVKFRNIEIGDISKKAESFETILTSQCIFGYGETKAKLDDGGTAIFRNGNLEPINSSDKVEPRKIVSWEIDNRISMYELEALYRKISFINTLVSDNTKFNKVILNNPRVEYYLSGLDFYEKGLLSHNLLQEWFRVIDERTDRLNKLTSDRLNNNFSIKFKSPLEELRGYVTEKIKSNSGLVFDDALKVLSQDQLWSKVMSLKKPVSWLDLVETSEAVEELRNSFETGEGTVVVKSPKHEITFYHSRDIAELLNSNYNDNFNLVAMYPHERIIVTHDTPKRTLLSYIPEPMTISSAKDVISQYNLNKD